MFIGQPEEGRFGDVLKNEFLSGNWSEVRIAVAWVRRSGIEHLADEILTFLGKGGSCHVLVGLDFSNTTKEGLDGLMALSERSSNFRAFAYHNEGGPTFHPKLYLFCNDVQSRIYVGSNNLTESGLYSNTEATLCVDFPSKAEEIVQAIQSWKNWTDSKSGLCRELDRDLIADLLSDKYIRHEQEVHRQLSTDRKISRTKHLFKSKSVARPKKKVGKTRATLPRPTHAVTLPSPAYVPSAKFWIETGSLTGGSRNQLDLSMVSKHGRIRGSISLFGVDPDAIKTTMSITIRYKGVDYLGNAIKFPRTSAGKTNGTWRLQLNGKSPSGNKLTQLCPNFVQKIIMFSKIGNEHYEITQTIPKTKLKMLKANSIKWDQNRPDGNHYGSF